MSEQLIGGVVGAAVGFYVGGPTGAQYGWMIGSTIGAVVTPGPNTKGPRLEDLKITGFRYGEPIPRLFGHPRVAGQVWWASDRQEVKTTTEAGKGGGPTSTTYTYKADLLYGVSDCEIDGIARIWLNGKLVWSNHADSSDATLSAHADAPWDGITVYTGASDQMPDPTYEAAVGAGNAPAYRGRGSVMIQGLQLGPSGVIPNLEFEVVVDGDVGAAITRLQTYFDDDDSADISAYANGAGVATNASISDGALDVAHSTADAEAIKWIDASLAPDGTQSVSLECIVEFGSQPNIAYTTILEYVPNTAFPTDYYRFGYYGESGDIIYDTSDFGPQFITSTPPASPTHLRLVIGEAGLGVYINGVRVYWDAGDHRPEASAEGWVTAGDQYGYESESPIAYKLHEFALRFREMNTDAFEAPELIDPPDGNSIDPNEQTIQEVVESLCADCMPAGTYDANALSTITKPVRGYHVPVTTTRAVLEQLASLYFFDAYVTDKLYFVPRGGSVVEAVVDEDRGCGEDDAAQEVLPISIAADMEISAQVAMTYANAAADYNAATEYSDRLLTEQINTATLSTPAAFTSEEAKGIVDAMVQDGYAGRISGELNLPLSYSELVPTDVVTAADVDGNTYRVRLVRRVDSGAMLRFDWVTDDAQAIVSAGITSDDYTPTLDIATQSDTVMRLLDIPLLRDADDTLGHYVAAKGAGDTWAGGSIQRSVDGVEYTEEARVTERAVIGVTTTVLPDFTGGNVFDEVSSVTVSIGSGTLSSSTRAAMLADETVNAMLVGSEVIRFRTATGSAGVYVLTGLLRGQRGSELAMDGHAVGDVVVLLREAGLRYIDIDTPSLSAERFYKGVTLGRSLATADAVSFTSDGVSLKPFAPVQVRALPNASTRAIDVTWNRRTRLASTFTGAAGAVVPLGEESEQYSVDVVRTSDSEVLRTITSTTDSISYTAAQQSADGVTSATGIRFDVHQVSAIVGRGYAGSVTTVGAFSPQAQEVELTVGGVFETGAVLFATLGGTTYTHTSTGGDTNLNGIATSLAAVIDAAAAYSASAAGPVVTVEGAASTAFPVVAGVRAGDNVLSWSLTQTASATVEGVSEQYTVTWRNLADPAGENAYPEGAIFGVLVQRLDPPLNLFYQHTNDGARTDYTVLPSMASGVVSDFASAGDFTTYGFAMIVDPVDDARTSIRFYTPASDPFNWEASGYVSFAATTTPLSARVGVGVEPATLRPQIVTLTLAGTVTTSWTYRATLAGDNFDYVALGGDDMDAVATGLAAVIDADPDFIAGAAGSVITIEHASDNVPFTYSATVIASTVTLTAAITQEAV